MGKLANLPCMVSCFVKFTYYCLCSYVLSMCSFCSISYVNSAILVCNCMVWEGFKLFMAYLLHYKTSKWSKTSISCGRIVINIPLNSGRICLNSRVKLATLHETVSQLTQIIVVYYYNIVTHDIVSEACYWLDLVSSCAETKSTQEKRDEITQA